MSTKKTYVCETCAKAFGTKGQLVEHRNSAKYCLKLRGKKEGEKKFICECSKVFYYRSSYGKHVSVCKNRVLKEKDEEFRSLQEIND